jgi:hypothetical protein
MRLLRSGYRLFARNRYRISNIGSSAGRALSVLVASVWLFHGLYAKLLDGIPRHRLIVQSLPGLAGAPGHFLVLLIGAAEVALAGWVLSGLRPRLAAATQTVLLLAMNLAELTWARTHLLFPVALIPVNLIFLSLAWLAAEAQVRRSAGKAGRLAVPLHLLQRHPLPIDAFFDHCLVLTYAFPEKILRPLLPPGLTLDTHNGLGFVAVAMVQTRDLRPAGLPRCLGQDFFLTGYRVFVKFKRPDGRTVRGLRILRSDTDRRRMVTGGNLLTHYNYRKCDAIVAAGEDRLEVAISTPHGAADLHAVADLSAPPRLPFGSPFKTAAEARRFAGPLPFTFDCEPQTHSIIAIRGVRENWSPRLVDVDVRQLNFFNAEPFRRARPILASAFYVRGIPYRWERGVRYPLTPETS